MGGENGFSKEAGKALIEWIKERYDPLDSLTADEAAPLLRIPAKTLLHYARSNQIPKIQSGRHIRFSPIALAYWFVERQGIPYMKPGERKGEDEHPGGESI